MANRKNNQGNLYAPYASNTPKRPASHGRKVGKGSVSAKKTERVNPVPYGGEDSIAPPSAANDGEWKPNGTHNGHPSYSFVGNAMSQTGRIQNKKKKPSPKSGSSRNQNR